MTKDLMFKDEIQELVRGAYEVSESPGGPGTRYYSESQLAGLPEEASQWSLGMGNPLAHVELRPGETVVDLGCGAGVDAMLAAAMVGPGAYVIGIDFLPSMVERARRLAEAAGLENVEFLQSEIEDLPLPDESADLVISNGSINLSARKSRVFAEAHRVLRRDGRLCASEPVIQEEDLPPQILTHPSAWAG